MASPRRKIHVHAQEAGLSAVSIPISFTQVAPFAGATLTLTGNTTISSALSSHYTLIDTQNNFLDDLIGSNAGTYNFSKTQFGPGVHFIGSGGADKIFGPSNGGWLEGGGGADTILGGAGNDTVYVAPTDISKDASFNGGGGQNLLELANGTDLAVDATTPVKFQTLQLDGTDTIGSTQIAGFTTLTTINGFTETVYGSNGGTYNFTGKRFGAGVHFVGSSNADMIIGPDNGAWLEGGGGRDTIMGGAGNDTVYVASQDIYLGASVNGGLGQNMLELANGTNLSTDSTTPVNFQTLQLDGSVTVGSAQIANFTTITTINGFTESLYGSNAGTYDFSKLDFASGVHFVGDGNADLIIGPSTGAWLEGGGGADTIMGGAGNDLVYVTPQDVAQGEMLDGGGGGNTLELANGTDLSVNATTPSNFQTLQIDGKASIDSAQIANFTTITTINGFIENLVGSNGGTYNFSAKEFGSGVHFIGSGNADKILGPSNGGWLEGGGGKDTIVGGAGNDTVYVTPSDLSPGASFNGGGGLNLLELASGVNLGDDRTTPVNFQHLQIDGQETITSAQLSAFATITTINNFNEALVGDGTGTYSLLGKTTGSGLQLAAGTGTESLVGGTGDYLAGGVGNDTLVAASGGVVTLVGGSATTLFVLDKGAAAGDSILNFTGAGAPGGDVLDLNGFGKGASLTFVDGSTYAVNFTGGSETITVSANHQLAAGDYKFT